MKRFIPAGAGNTGTGEADVAATAVHPCGRREHSSILTLRLYDHGSSLRAQGTPVLQQPEASEPRFIPAGAGNTEQGGWDE